MMQPFPSWRYKKGESPRLVNSPVEAEELGKGWVESPALIEGHEDPLPEKPNAVPEMPLEHGSTGTRTEDEITKTVAEEKAEAKLETEQQKKADAELKQREKVAEQTAKANAKK